MSQKQRIAVLTPSLSAGGIARVVVNIASEFQKSGYPVDLIALRPTGDLAGSVPSDLHRIHLKPANSLTSRLHIARHARADLARLGKSAIFPLAPSFVQRYFSALADYLESRQPAVLLSANTPANLLAIWAREAAGVDTRVIVSEHTHLSAHARRTRKWRWHHIAPAVACTYPRADGIVAVSDGVADDLAETARLPRNTIRTIYNPVITPRLAEQGQQRPEHRWFGASDVPVIVTAGRFKAQKNFSLLLDAFALLRRQRKARLVLLGDGNEAASLKKRCAALGIANDISMPGFADNPYAYFAHASLFVLSSNWEGLPTVLIEAMACGCPVVSTDCPSGPAEILENGRHGALVPMGDASALAEAMAKTLDAPPSSDALKARAQRFRSDRVAREYLDYIFS